MGSSLVLTVGATLWWSTQNGYILPFLIHVFNCCVPYGHLIWIFPIPDCSVARFWTDPEKKSSFLLKDIFY